MSIHQISKTDFIAALNIELPPAEDFVRLGDLLALRCNKFGKFFRSNYERGILLYALVAQYRPQKVLEFGTGRGYGTMCMAWAMEDCQINGYIWTIDRIGSDMPMDWAIDWGKGPQLDRISRQKVWRAAVPNSWLSHIKELTGYSGAIMSQWSGPAIEFAYIDAGHNFRAVHHDFLSALEISAEQLGVLFDDFTTTPGYGVRRFIEEEVAPHFDTYVLTPQATANQKNRVGDGDVQALNHSMAWIHSSTAKQSLDSLYPPEYRHRFLRTYRLREFFSRVRYALSQRLRTWNLGG